MDFRIREYKLSDFEQVWRIDQKCFAPGISYSKAELMFYLRRRGSFAYVGEAEDKPGELAGFIVGETKRNGVGHIITIDVLPEAQRSGLGSRLMQQAEIRLRQAGAPAVLLETAVNNESAVAFYKRHGYEILKTAPRYYNNELDALVMGKRLV